MSLRIVGIIGKPHGTRGEVTVRWITDYPETIKKGDTLFVLDGKKKLTVESIRQKQVKEKKIPLVKFTEFNHDQAQEYNQEYIWRADTPELEQDHFWLDDLPGCDVYDKETFIGTVRQVLDCPANQVLVVEDKGRSTMIPFIETYIKEVDPASRRITLKKLPKYI